jgi:cleavage and polyadenylation specificity factor subunit 1
LICQSEEKNPVTALSSINGYLIAAIGTKVIIHTYDEEGITGIAFLDVNLYVTSLCVVKNLILVGDILKSVCLLAFQEEPPKITLIGKDFTALGVYASNVIVGVDSDLSFVVADGERNLHLVQYNPFNISSIGGSRLIRRGEISSASQIQSISRLRCIQVEGDDGKKGQEEDGLSRQHFNICSM